MVHVKNKQTNKKLKREQRRRYFPPGPVVENLPSSAGDVGLIPGRGTKTPHSQINKYQMASCFLAAVAEVSRTLTLSFSYIHTVATLILP